MLPHEISEADNRGIMIRKPHLVWITLAVQTHKNRFSTAAKHCTAFKNVMTLAEPGGSRRPGRGLPVPQSSCFHLWLSFPSTHTSSTRDGINVLGLSCLDGGSHRSHPRIHLGRTAQSARPSWAVFNLCLTSWLGELWKEWQTVKCSL